MELRPVRWNKIRHSRVSYRYIRVILPIYNDILRVLDRGFSQHPSPMTHLPFEAIYVNVPEWKNKLS